MEQIEHEVSGTGILSHDDLLPLTDINTSSYLFYFHRLSRERFRDHQHENNLFKYLTQERWLVRLVNESIWVSYLTLEGYSKSGPMSNNIHYMAVQKHHGIILSI